MSLKPIAKQVDVRVRSVDRENFTVDADVSDESVDRDGEIILLSSWTKRLENYLKNPLLCWMHPVGWSFEVRQPEDILGKSLVTEVQPASLFCRFQYAVNENPKAKMCFDLIAGDYLRSYSIGAIPYGPVYSDAPEIVLNMLPEPARLALQAGDAWCVHTDMELLEVSNVFVGSNREALARACRDGVVSKALAPELFRSISAREGNLWAVSRQLEAGSPQLSASLATLSAAVEGLTARVAGLETKALAGVTKAEVTPPEDQAAKAVTADDIVAALLKTL